MDGGRPVTGRWTRPLRAPFFASVSFEKEMLKHKKLSCDFPAQRVYPRRNVYEEPAFQFYR